MKVLILGAGGLLGQEIVRVAKRETEWQLLTLSKNYLRSEKNSRLFDLHDYHQWQRLVENVETRPDVIINAAAATNVDQCEVEREQAWKINVTLVEILVHICRSYDIRLVQISTDYIFDGSRGPYTETDTPNPINYYGRTKLAAENLCIRKLVEYSIVRTMWLYGEASGGKTTFVDWVLNMLKAQTPFGVVTDEVGTATLTEDVAYAIIKMIDSSFRGIVNIGGAELQSRWQFAQDIAKVFKQDSSMITKITTKQLKRYAKRPLNSGLIIHKAQAILGHQPTSPVEGLELLRTLAYRRK
jgi:dTDP-4-dehydrorhamnose reductase